MSEEYRRRELNILRPKEQSDKITQDTKYKQWKNFPKDVKKEMPKSVFDALKKQHN